MKKIRWAICGLGRIAERFYSVSKLIPEIDIVACASSDKIRAEKWAKEHDIKNFYTYDELYKSADIDVVYVATNNHLHCENVCGLVKNNKAVLCEKPFSINDVQTNQMLELAKNQNVLVMEAMWTRFLPATNKIIDIVKSKQYGKVIGTNGLFNSIMDYPAHRIFYPEFGGGSLLDLGVYPISYTYSLFGMPKKIVAKAISKNYGVETSCDITFEYENHESKITSNCLAENRLCQYFIEFENAKIVIDNFTSAMSFDILHKNGKTEKVDFEQKDGFYYEIKHFCDLFCDNKKESPIRPFIDTQNVQKLMTECNVQMGINY